MDGPLIRNTTYIYTKIKKKKQIWFLNLNFFNRLLYSSTNIWVHAHFPNTPLSNNFILVIKIFVCTIQLKTFFKVQRTISINF